MSAGKWVRAQVLCHKAATSDWERFQTTGSWEEFHFTSATFLWPVPSIWCWSVLGEMGPAVGSGVFSQPSTSTSNLDLSFSGLRRQSHSGHPVRVDSKVPGQAFSHLLVCFPQSDQIDENLKLALQQDLTTMAPGLIIQVIRIPPRDG